MPYQLPDRLTAMIPDPRDPANPNARIKWEIGWSELEDLPRKDIDFALDYVIGGRRRLHYHRAILESGTAQDPAGVFAAFATGRGEEARTWNTNTEFVQSAFHTSMYKGGEFTNGVAALVLGFRLIASAPPARAATEATGNNIGMITSAADHASQPSGYNATQFLLAFINQNRYEFRRGEKKREDDGLLIDIPSGKRAISASYGAGTNNVLVQNTVGYSVDLDRIKPLESRFDFRLEITPLSALAIPILFTPLFCMDVLELGND